MKPHPLTLLPGCLVVGLGLTLFPFGRSGAAPPASPAAAGTNAPARAWAVKIEKPGLENFHRVSSHLYRGAQPTAQGMRELEKLGIKTAVSLRAFHTDRDEAAGTRLQRERISFKSWHPEDEDVRRFLLIVTDTNRWPVFVHCQFGSDRTGTMVAVYRMVVEGWSRDEAIAEMTQGDFGFHPVWQNLLGYLRDFDAAAWRRRLAAPR